MNLLEIEELPKSKPYMLRNDGVLLECGDIHPYIKYSYNLDSHEGLIDLIDSHSSDLEWFYKNTNSKIVKNQIEQILFSLYKYPALIKADNKIVTELIYKLFDLEYNPEEIIDNPNTLYNVFEELNTNTNQEFCRARMSNIRFGGSSNSIYFRISSIHFNWFDLIWSIVVRYNNISDITIVKDPQTFGGGYDVYNIKSNPIEHMPREEFLTLEGNPIIETFNSKLKIIEEAFEHLNKGTLITEAYYYVHPKYAMGYYKNDVATGGLEYDFNNILYPVNIKYLLN